LERDFGYRYRGSRPTPWSEVAATSGAMFDYEEHGDAGTIALSGLSVAMLGRHQAANAAVALAAIGRLRDAGWRISDSALRTGLGRVHCPARAEVVRSQPVVVLDAAHNVASVQALLDVLAESFPQCRRRILVFAVSKDKDTSGILSQLLPRFEVLVLTRFQNNPRSAEPEALAEAVHAMLASHPLCERRVIVQPDSLSAWQTALSLAGADDLICIAGSFFLAAELRPVVA
jgi:dihydrofolate synthase/folylpolyglutamate synthase